MNKVNRSLSTVWVVARQEFNLLFNSPIIYFIGAVWLFVMGLIFMLNFQQMNLGQRNPEISSTINTMIFMLLFFAPAMTMRLVSEELRAGTHELLFTSPVQEWEIIVGKWLGVFLAFSIFIVLTVVCPIILVMRGSPDLGAIGASYLGLWLAAGATLAIGVFASSLTQYQLVAFLVSLVILLTLWLIEGAVQLIANVTVTEFLAELSLLGRSSNFTSRALIDPVDIAYFLGVIIISLFLASQVLGSRRYTG